MTHLYTLDAQHNILVTEDSAEWGTWFQDFDNRRVAQTKLGPVEVSTVFLGLDHRWLGGGPPLLFETMVFGGADEVCLRCSTWAEAEAQHAEVVASLDLSAR